LVSFLTITRSSGLRPHDRGGGNAMPEPQC
jgi:hypothetical protein